jgi:hypothetical protein
MTLTIGRSAGYDDGAEIAEGAGAVGGPVEAFLQVH